MLRETQLTLEKAIALARADEETKKQMRQMTNRTSLPESVDSLHKKGGMNTKAQQNKYGNKTDRSSFQKKGKTHTKDSKECTRCGYKHPPKKCPAFGQKCSKCKKMNHYSRVCKSIQEIVEKVSAFDSEESDYQVDAVIGDNTKGTWKVDLDICNKMITFKIDTGADVTVIPLSTYNKLKLPELCHSSSNLSSPGGNLKTVGEFRAKTTYKGKRYSFKIAVVDQPSMTKQPLEPRSICQTGTREKG